MKKRIIILIISVLLLFSSCGKKTDESTSTAATETETTMVAETTEENSAEQSAQELNSTSLPQTTAVQTTKPKSAKTTTTSAPAVEVEKPLSQATAGANAKIITGFEGEMLKSVNKQRKAAGLNELTLNEILCSNAQVRAKEITDTFSHTRPDSGGCFTAVTVDYSYVGENIAAGQKNVDEVMTGWMNSEGHRANILSPNFTTVGFAQSELDGKKYWVQIFASLY